MSEINHKYWNKIFKRLADENVDQNTLLHLLQDVKDMKKDITVMQQQFEETINNDFQAGMKQIQSKKDMSEEIQHNAACTSTATLQDIETAEARFKKFSNHVQGKYADNLKEMNLTKQDITDKILSDINLENSCLIADDRHLMFKEIMYQNEIKKVHQLIDKFVDTLASVEGMVWMSKEIETFNRQINLISNVLELEEQVLKFKLQRDQQRMTKRMELLNIEMINMSSDIDEETSNLMIDNQYLRFVETTRNREVNRILLDLQIYCDKYNLPNEEIKVAAHRDFIMQRIEMLKVRLNVEIIDFDLHIEKEATDMKTKKSKATNMSSKVDNVKNTMMRSNKYLRYIIMKHQETINGVYAQLQTFCNEYNTAIEKGNIAAHRNVGADDVEKINKLKKISEKCKLKKSNKYFRSIRDLYEKQFISLFYQLHMYNNKYDMPGGNVKIVMHSEPYDPTKTNDEENELKKDNEYLAFIAMMHLEKIRDMCFFFRMYQNRFDEKIKNITKDKNFINQEDYMIENIVVTKQLILYYKEYLQILEGF